MGRRADDLVVNATDLVCRARLASDRDDGAFRDVVLPGMSSGHPKIHREILRGARHLEQMQDDERLQKPGLEMSLRAMPLSAQPPHRGRVDEQDLAMFARALL